MKYTAKEYHIWKHKTTNKAIGKVVEIKEGDSIDNYVEVELPEPIRRWWKILDGGKNRNNE